MTTGRFVAIVVGIVVFNGGNVAEEIVIAPVTGGGNAAEGCGGLRCGSGP